MVSMSTGSTLTHADHNNRSTIWGITPDCSVVQRGISQIASIMHVHIETGSDGERRSREVHEEGQKIG